MASNGKEDGPNRKRTRLAREDVEQLLSNPSAAARAHAAEKVAGELRDGALSINERVVAEGIFRVMAKLRSPILKCDDLSSSTAAPATFAIRLRIVAPHSTIALIKSGTPTSTYMHGLPFLLADPIAWVGNMQ